MGQVYLKCKFTGNMLSSSVIKFESIYFGYPAGGCLVDNSHLKQIEDNSWLVRLVGSVNENDERYPTPKDKEYVYVKINSVLDQGLAHFLVPKKNIVYLEN